MSASFRALEVFLNDNSISELMWNRFDQLFVERQGAIYPVPSPFTTVEQFDQLLSALASLPNAVKGAGSVYVDGVLPDGSRFHITRAPLSPQGGTLTVRKFSSQHRGLENLIASGFVSKKAVTFLEACIQGRLNILISGATGAGKTTLLNALASRVSQTERLITIEDVAELKLSHPNWIRMLALHDPHVVTVRDCLIGALRMRPDRILVGECRSAEALEMLQAMNTGNDGGMTTLHANSTGDALTRLESLILFYAGAEIPLRALRRQIVDALDLVIQVAKGPQGQRRIVEIITRLPLFKWDESRGRLIGTGHAPKVSLDLPKGFFDPSAYEDAA